METSGGCRGRGIKAHQSYRSVYNTVETTVLCRVNRNDVPTDLRQSDSRRWSRG